MVKNIYQTWTVVPVTRAVATTKMSVFTNVEFVDRHFVYDFCDGNSLAT
jgi:hypothetical protein